MITQPDIVAACRASLEDLIALTRAITECVEHSNFGGLELSLQRREDLLNASISLLGQLPPRDTSTENGAQLKVLAEELQSVDRRLKETLNAMKKQLAVELRTAENQKKLTAYSK